MFLSQWREFPSAPYLAGKKKNLMTARVSMLLKSRTSLTFLRDFFPSWSGKGLINTQVLTDLVHICPQGTYLLYRVLQYN